jgi:hypothetical protein
MPLLLPNLDDRTWADLADEGRALIPVYGSEWTDHNASDPGITLVELLAWVTEMDIYRLNQISDAERLRFLALVGVRPRPPLPASVVLSLTLATNSTVLLPQGVEFSGIDPNGIETRFQTTRSITLVPGGLQSLQYAYSGRFQDLTAAWRRQSPLFPFGPGAQVGAEFYLGLSAALPIDTPVSLYFTFGDGYSSEETRHRILEEQASRRRACRCLRPDNPCQKAKGPGNAAPVEQPESSILTHYGVRTVWEYLGVSGGVLTWLPLAETKGQVVDETRAFTLDGEVTVRVPSGMVPGKVGAIAAPQYYLRCRIAAGHHDAPPVLRDVAYNGVRVFQTDPAAATFEIDPECAVTYNAEGPPKPNQRTAFRVGFDGRQRIVKLDFGGGAAGDPQFLVLDYLAPAPPVSGSLTLQAAFLGYGNGFPAQQVTFPGAPMEPWTVRVYTQERDCWYAWRLREDFLSSTRRDFHAVLDPTTGALTFGNGEHGRVPPELKGKGSGPFGDCLIFADYETTRAQSGNLAAGQINSLTDSPHNRALLYDPSANPDGWSVLKSELSAISSSLPAVGGQAAESVELAAGRADQLVESSGRAVTLQDYEDLAGRTPGTRIARVTAFASLYPDFPCFQAPGMVTVIILPFLPQGHPVPTAGLLQAVRSYLRPRRVIGTRVEVVGPTYLQVTVNATVQSKAGVNKTNLQESIVAALNTFFDPLVGGPEGTGWPFGRDVYRAEVMKVVDGVSGVDYVSALDLIPGDGPAQCGNVCLASTWLVASGAHQIQVL